MKFNFECEDLDGLVIMDKEYMDENCRKYFHNRQNINIKNHFFDKIIVFQKRIGSIAQRF